MTTLLRKPSGLSGKVHDITIDSAQGPQSPEWSYVGFGLLFLSLIVAVSKYSVGINTFMHISAISLLPHSLYSLFGSSVLASLIAIEETLKTKSNRSVSENEI